MALHINIFGAPGAGKSTMRSRLFYELKKRHYKVEEIMEYAKILTYEENSVNLSDQLLILGQQHHKHFILDKKVDYIITDSPFIMGLVYLADDYPFKKELKNFSLSLNNSYESLNFFIERNHKYQQYGRNQTEKESDMKSLEIKAFLDNNKIPYISVKSGEEFIEKALEEVIKPNNILVISGFSGAGKDTVAKELKERYNYKILLSHTNRPMREKESQGDPYIFVSKEDMKNLDRSGALVSMREYRTKRGVWYYGIRKEDVKPDEKYVVVLDIEGAKEFKKHFGDRVNIIYLDVPTSIRKERAIDRGSFDEEEWNRRYEADLKIFKGGIDYDLRITNLNLDETIEKISNKYF